MEESVGQTGGRQGRRAWLGLGHSYDSGTCHRHLANCRRRTHECAVRGDFKSFFQLDQVTAESGSAVAGFALAGPLIALLLSAVLALSGALWQREVAQSLLSKSVSEAAKHRSSLAGDPLNAVSLAEAEQQFISNASAAGMQAKELEWLVTRVDGIDILQGESLLLLGGGAIPTFEVKLRALAVVG